MEVRSLKNTTLEDIVSCLLSAFADYFVKMPEDINQWRDRFKGARVDYALSFGMFEVDKLVGFIMSGIDEREGELVAFNSGTGVIPAFRGKAVVDEIYAAAIPQFLKRGIRHCALEVIQKDERAIRVYERIGFVVTKDFKCFRGVLNTSKYPIDIHEVSFKDLIGHDNPNSGYYSWENCNNAVLAGGEIYKAYLVSENQQNFGYFVINPKTGYLPQFEIFEDKGHAWDKLFEGIAQVSSNLRINNVDHRRKDLIEALLSIGLENHVDQFEMEMIIEA